MRLTISATLPYLNPSQAHVMTSNSPLPKSRGDGQMAKAAGEDTLGAANHGPVHRWPRT